MGTISSFTTSDTFLAAFLIAKGAHLVGTDDTEPMRVKFILSPKPSSEDIEGYASETAMVNAVGYARALRQLRRAYRGG